MRLSWTPQNGLGLLLREVDRNEPVLKIVHDEAVQPFPVVIRFLVADVSDSATA